MSNNLSTNNSNYIQQCIFSNMVEYKLETVKETVHQVSGERAKDLTISLLEASKTAKNLVALTNIAKAITLWEENKNLQILREDIMCMYSCKKDVNSIYLCRDNQIVSFIVVMDDSTADSVFLYNEIGFQLSEKYTEIEDFMIIDTEEEKGCLRLLSNYNLIYKRG